MAASSQNILLGTSGWSYKEWIGPFYTKYDKSMLRAYTKVFNTVEIDSTFYRYPSTGTVMGWSRYSPEEFVYAAKLPRLITHEKKLELNRGIEQDLERFLELMEPLSLNGKLGCILIQLPPKFNFRPEQLEAFLAVLPSHINFAIEFRHLSWMRNETWRLLEKYRVAYTIVDEPLLPSEVHLTSDFAYFRWHGHGARPWYDYRYKMEELEPWAPKVKEAAEKAQRVYGYFNNHYHGYAVENCLQILEMMELLQPKQLEAKSRVENYRKQTRQQTISTIDSFAAPKDMNFESLINYFVSLQRLKRAEQMHDSELQIDKQSDDHIEAKIREYHVSIDLKERTMTHDCADWGKIISTKRLCKHMAKVFLTIDQEIAVKILADLYRNEQSWNFRAFTQ